MKLRRTRNAAIFVPPGMLFREHVTTNIEITSPCKCTRLWHRGVFYDAIATMPSCYVACRLAGTAERLIVEVGVARYRS